MDIVKILQTYVQKMINNTPGMKILLLDDNTTQYISLIATQSTLLSKEVFLIDKIENTSREKMKHLKCICFLRPSSKSVQLMIDELRNPCYGSYYLYFSNILTKSQIERMAEADQQETVRELQEFYGDFCAINSNFYSLNLQNYQIFGDSLSTWNNETFKRTVEGLRAVLLALKKRPMIRYEKNSALGKRLASEINYQIQQESQLFDFRRYDTPPILLILDRKNDPVSPLLNQWTYQAMVHELIGINNGRVDLSKISDIKPDLKEIVLSADQDVFFKNNMYLNFGDLGVNIKNYVNEFQNRHHNSDNIESISDMKKFVEEYPEFKRLSGNVSKHVTLVSELSRLVSQNSLLEVSELEQNLACVNNNNDLKEVQNLIKRSNITNESKIKLVLLYTIRYGRQNINEVKELVQLLLQNGISEEQTRTIEQLIKYAELNERQNEETTTSTIFDKGKNVFKGLKGVENVYTQYTSKVADIIQSLLKGKLKDQFYPYIEGSIRDRPQDIVVFIIGGATYGEARDIAKLNEEIPNVRIIIGGTSIHNTKSFISFVKNATSVL
ncbi:Sec1-like protein [Piromyces finnis]|uniref:Vacuolar protein sorting-associated protein 45 n=1 Tax=Piromyces finnis TaxID=1754191 RepID=A0A1Y1V5X2_9FUNG|nr:Sec1-like protein [Piromyces finnis]|eukprot:ORX46678.1 Sec1-like protein [Piromyces finnis]